MILNKEITKEKKTEVTTSFKLGPVQLSCYFAHLNYSVFFCKRIYISRVTGEQKRERRSSNKNGRIALPTQERNRSA